MFIVCPPINCHAQLVLARGIYPGWAQRQSNLRQLGKRVTSGTLRKIETEQRYFKAISTFGD